jgi:hypothetical protein
VPANRIAGAVAASRRRPALWARNRHELLLIGARGNGVCPRFRDIAPADSVIEGQQREHSRKPDRAAEIIEAYHPGVPKLEMFAHASRPGWDAWGTEVGLLDNGPVQTRRWASDSWPGAAPNETGTRPVTTPAALGSGRARQDRR